MSVHRLSVYNTEDPFTRVPNEAINDPRLDLKARGLLVFMLSKPDGWTFREKNLANQTGVGLGALRTAMARLIECGYVVREWAEREGGPPIMVTKVFDKANPAGIGFSELGKSEDGKTRPLSNESVSVTKEVVRKTRAKTKKGIPDDWEPGQSLLQELASKFPKVVAKAQVEPFRDYWLAKGELRADWDATFRSWMRNQDKWRKEREGVSEGGWR